MKRVMFLLLMGVLILSWTACLREKKLAVSPADLPAGLAVAELPQFVLLGSDDNGISGAPGSKNQGGITFMLDLLGGQKNPVGMGQAETFDDTRQKMTFFLITNLLESTKGEPASTLAPAWRSIDDAGHEIALHTHSHPHGYELSVENWLEEMNKCRDRLTAPQSKGGIGIPAAELIGFRTPYLEYNPATFVAIEQMGLRYDCSIEEGMRPHEDGSNFLWPYRLIQGGPGDQFNAQYHKRGAVGKHPKIWEIPVYVYLTPPDELCAQYGLEPGFRDRLGKRIDYFKPQDGKITGFDWNLWVEFAMNKQEFLATLKYSLDMRLNGNRAPFHLGLHSDIYSDGYEPLPASKPLERQAALREFMAYATAKPMVRVVSFRDLLTWLEQPKGLGNKQ